MSTAIYTVRSLSELRAIKQPHPLRSVSNGDYVHLIGDVNRDDCAFFQAAVTDSPVESFPDSIVSDDGKIQWNMISHGFFDSGIPNSITMEGRFNGSPPAGWSSESVKPKAYALGYLQEVASYQGMTCDHINGKVWITTENIVEFDLSTMSSVVHLVGTLTDGTSNLTFHGRCYSKLEDKLHILDTAGNHHLFDVPTTTMTLAAKAAYPATVNRSMMIDASQEDGKLFYFGRLSPYEVYEYNISTDTWTFIQNMSSSIASFAPDPYNTGKFIVCFYLGGVYTLDPVASTLTLKHDITDYNTIVEPYYSPSSLIWDSQKGLFFSPDLQNLLYYDPLTGDTGISTEVEDPIGKPIGANVSTPIGDDFHFLLDDDSLDAYWAINITPYAKYQKVRP